MKKKKRRRQKRIKRIAGAVLVAGLIAGGVFFFRSRPNRTEGETETVRTETAPKIVSGEVSLGEYSYDSQSEELILDTLPENDWENLLRFPHLRKLTVNSCDNAEAVEALRDKGVELHYNVALAGKRISSLTPTLTIEDADSASLTSALPLLPALRTLRMENCSLSDSEKLRLQQNYPDLLFVWDVKLGNKSCRSTAASLTIAKGQAGVSELMEKLPLFPLLKDVDISDCGFTMSEINSLQETLPKLHFVWSVELLGKTYSSDVTEIDLSGIQMSDSSAVEAALPFLPKLKKLVMCDCGFTNEQMDALNRKYEDVRFVWRVYFGSFYLRTDATAFIAADESKYPTWTMLYDKDCEVLKYCTDLIAVDLGHMAVSDLSFVRYMPHLQYLVVVEAYVEDLTPLADCKELKYLELFKCPIVDLAPLLEVKSLEDLNICYIWIPTDLAYEQLSQMTWLDRLWFCGTWFTEAQKAELQAKMPDCEMDMRWGAESTGGTWRKHEHYYEMRDAFDMYYMPGGTNGVNEEGEWVVITG